MQMKAAILFLCVTIAVVFGGCASEVDMPGPEPVAAPPADAAPPEPVAAPDVEEAAFDIAAAEPVFRAACMACHPLDRIERHASEKLAEEPWSGVVTRMIEENGAEISPDDQQIVLSYLEAKYTN